MIKRKKTRKIRVGKIFIGGDAPIFERFYAGGTGTPFPYTIMPYEFDSDTLTEIGPFELDCPLVLSASGWQVVPDGGTPQTYGNCVALGPPHRRMVTTMKASAML
jgi:hypothetical protein